MPKVEKKTIGFILGYKNLLMFLIISALGLTIRLKLIAFQSYDFIHFLSPWYDQIKSLGGLKALKFQVGNYGITYQFLIALFTYLPGKSIFWYKVLSIFFDYVLAITGAEIYKKISGVKENFRPLIVYAIILFTPVVILNSSVWGQCDSIYVSFICLSLLSMLHNKNRLSFVFLGIAFAFKLQAVFVLPVYLLVYLKNRNFSILNFLWSLVSFYCCNLPGALMRHSLTAPFKPFVEQAATYQSIINLHYPNLSGLIHNNLPVNRSLSNILCSFLMLLTMGIIIIGAFYLISRDTSKFSSQELILFSIWIIWTCVIFLPAMHERYGYAAEVLLIIVSAVFPVYWINTIVLITTTFIMYSYFLFSAPMNITILSFIMIINYFVYTFMTFSKGYLSLRTWNSELN